MALTKANVRIVSALAEEASLDTSVVLAMVDKESSGKVTWNIDGQQLPAIRPETHKFYAFLEGDKRAEAVRQGLAAKKRGAIPIPGNYKARYEFFDRMRKIDNRAALMSISMGLGQVMGFNYKQLGFATVDQMWQQANGGLAGQVNLLIRYIKSLPALVRAVNNRDYATIGKLYNGPAFKENKYDTDLSVLTAGYDTGSPRTEPLSYASRVITLGYEDVRAFQRARGIAVDGIVGPITIENLRDAEAEVAKQVNLPVTKATKVGVVATVLGLGTALSEQVVTWLDASKPLLDTIKTIGTYGPAAVGVVAGGVALTAIGYVVYKHLK